MSKVTFDYSKAAPFIGAHEVDFMKKQVMDAKDLLVSKTGAGNDFLGWLHLPSSITQEHLEDIKATAQVLRENCEVVIVAGIGGSYLGARAVIEALSNSFTLS